MVVTPNLLLLWLHNFEGEKQEEEEKKKEKNNNFEI